MNRQKWFLVVVLMVTTGTATAGGFLPDGQLLKAGQAGEVFREVLTGWLDRAAD